MRSRYTAYACGHLRHLIASTAPESPHHRADPARWREELRGFCDGVRFDGLEVRHTAEEGDRGEVTFFARLTRREDAADVSFGERSRFVRRGGRWLYVDGDRVP
jgi:SEC-C motif-containing protein